jgi:hypothetical protein
MWLLLPAEWLGVVVLLAEMAVYRMESTCNSF